MGVSVAAPKVSPGPFLEPSQSAELRDKLIAELDTITSAEQAASWAGQALAAKNSLTASDASLVEAAFEQRLSEFPSSEVAARSKEDARTTGIDVEQNAAAAEPVADRSAGIDKSTLAIPAPRRYRNREHLRFVMQQPCLICGRKPSDPHHLRYTQPRALGCKAMNSPCRSAARITAPRIAPVTSGRGGRPRALIQLGLHASSGRKRAEPEKTKMVHLAERLASIGLCQLAPH